MELSDGQVNSQLEILHNIQTGSRYHMIKSDNYDRKHKLIGVASLVFGLGSVVVLTGEYRIFSSLLAAAIAGFQSFDLTFDFRGKSLLHDEIRRDYLKLECDVPEVEKYTSTVNKKFLRQLKHIEMKEPAVNPALVKQCQIEAYRAAGQKISNPSDQKLSLYEKLRVWFDLFI